jgi:hypothetical protein
MFDTMGQLGVNGFPCQHSATAVSKVVHRIKWTGDRLSRVYPHLKLRNRTGEQTGSVLVNR